MTDLVLVPAALALLPAYGSRVDPVPDLRAAAEAAVAWLVERSEELLVITGADRTGDPRSRPAVPSGLRVARHLAASALPATEVVVGSGAEGEVPAPGPRCGVLVVADGSARRSLKAPGHLDERSFALDESVEKALRSGDPARFAGLDLGLAEQLLCAAAPVLAALTPALAGRQAQEVQVDLAADPFGVQYWVCRWAGLDGVPA